jgi:hypothetical protein
MRKYYLPRAAKKEFTGKFRGDSMQQITPSDLPDFDVREEPAKDGCGDFHYLTTKREWREAIESLESRGWCL